MKVLHLVLIFGIVGFFLHGNTAFAHSFNVVFIAPLSDTAGRSALDGFLLATKEQDKHDFETSNGHLGGLDSHVFQIDSMAGKAIAVGRLKKTIVAASPLFATGLSLDEYQIDLLENSGVVVVDPASSPSWQDRLAQGEKLATMNGKLFFEAFERAYGYRPDDMAMRGYLAARVIADVVRQSSELDRSNPAVIEKMVGAALIEPPW